MLSNIRAIDVKTRRKLHQQEMLRFTPNIRTALCVLARQRHSLPG